jgi:capsular polysaccharide biosynthesis protein
LDGDVYFLDNVFSHTYGHHLTDDLPRLLAVKDKLPAATRYVVVAPLRDLKIKTLTALGVNMDDVVVVQGDDEVICERLWYINPLEDINWVKKDVCDLREKLLSAYCSEGEASSRRIFISRNNIDHRRLQNEEEILPILENYNFTIHYPERMKFEDQINSFKNAEIVAGAYGGGLINMIFSKNAKILELQDEMYAHRPWHWKLASLLGNSYYCLFGPLKNYDNHILQYGPPENCRGYLNTPFVINPDMLKRALDKIISD